MVTVRRLTGNDVCDRYFRCYFPISPPSPFFYIFSLQKLFVAPNLWLTRPRSHWTFWGALTAILDFSWFCIAGSEAVFIFEAVIIFEVTFISKVILNFGPLHFSGCLHSWGCVHFWGCLPFWDRLNFWGCLYLLGCLNFWSCLHFWGCFHLRLSWFLRLSSLLRSCSSINLSPFLRSSLQFRSPVPLLLGKAN